MASVSTPTGDSRNSVDLANTAEAIGGTTEELFRIWASQCKQKTTALQREAESFFRSISQSTTVKLAHDNRTLETKPSHEKAIAELIRALGPALESSPQSRVGALYCLCGALQGCSTLSVSLIQILSKFILVHCGPIQKQDGMMQDDGYNDDAEDYEEKIRDAALQCLAAVVASKLNEDDDVNNDGGDDDDENSRSDSLNIIIIMSRLQLAETGITHRCAEPEMATGYGGPSTARVASGLSTMPRSIRSLCFQILQSAVACVAPWLKRTTTTTTTSVKTTSSSSSSDEELVDCLVSFTKFASTCLHGESDPRCLLQLLQLLGSIQRDFIIVSTTSQFPIDEMFDAVAPYYPIQFTPPPNNPHGITKPALCDALLSVLSCTDYDEKAKAATRDTMLSLSIGIMLEHIIPPPEDGPATIVEQLQGTKDLEHLLLSRSPSSSVSKLELLDASGIRHLSDCLLALHEEASMAVLKGGAEVATAKELATLCRSLVSRLAFCCEQSSKRFMWDTFVAQPLQRLSSKLASMPSESRMAIAYMACLSSCGGAKTLQQSLRAGLKPLLDSLLKGLHDDRDVATAVYGIGAFCSSCRVALESMASDGVAVHPHPLEPYTAKILDKLCSIVATGVQEGTPDRVVAIQVAAVRSIDAVLTASPKRLFDASLVQKVTTLIEMAVDEVMVHRGGTPSQSIRDWQLACCQTIGGSLGKAMDEQSNAHEMSSTILAGGPLKSFLIDTVLPNLVSSASVSTGDPSRIRYDRKSLTLACLFSFEASRRIMGCILGGICNASTDEVKFGSAEAACVILKEGGALPSKAIQDSSLGSSLDSVLASMSASSGLPTRRSEKELEANFGKSVLTLPPTYQENTVKRSRIEAAYQIIPHLLPAYKQWVDPNHLEMLSNVVGQCLPPLSPSDTIKACVYIPFLSSALEKAPHAATSNAKVADQIIQILPYLSSFAIDIEFLPEARRFAGLCLFTGLVKILPRSVTDPCLVSKMCKDEIFPALTTIVQNVDKSSGCNLAEPCRALSGILSILTVLATSAAARGGQSTATSNVIVQFLVELAVDKRSVDHFSYPSGAGEIDFRRLDRNGQAVSNDLAIEAASAFGLILLGDGSTSLSKQRFAHRALSKLRELPMSGASMANARNVPINVGSIAVASHVVCSTNPKILGKSSLRTLTELVIGEALTKVGSPGHIALSMHNEHRLQKVVLAATMKLLCCSDFDQGLLTPSNLLHVVSGILQIYATSTNLTVKLLGLQGLEAVAAAGAAMPKSNAPSALLPLKPAVVSILEGAMNDPNSLLRQAGVQVRNSWCVL